MVDLRDSALAAPAAEDVTFDRLLDAADAVVVVIKLGGAEAVGGLDPDEPAETVVEIAADQRTEGAAGDAALAVNGDRALLVDLDRAVPGVVLVDVRPVGGGIAERELDQEYCKQKEHERSVAA